MISRIFMLIAFGFLSFRVASGQDAEAQALRAATQLVSNSVVQIETIGGASAGGELSLGAPISGTIIDREGHIITSLWGLDQTPASILVVNQSGARVPAELVARDYSRELVLLKIKPQPEIQPIVFERASPVTVGQWAVAVGRGITPSLASVSVGIVSATKRMHGRAVQIDARISPSFYGGPVVDIRGDVIGISVPMKPDASSAADKAGWYDSGIAFVVPGKEIAKRLDKLKSGQDIKAGKMGIVPNGKMPFKKDVRVSAVMALSPAKRAGIQVDDQLIAIEGQPVRWVADIKQILGNRDAGESVVVRLKRDEKEIEISVDLVAEIEPFRPQIIGVMPLVVDDRIVAAHVFKDSPAEKAGLRNGDEISSVDGKEAGEIAQLRLQLGTHPSNTPLSLALVRDGKELSIECELERISDQVPADVPEANEDWESEKWKVTERTLPDVPNKAFLLNPETDSAMGLLVILARPGDEKVKRLLDPWRSVAAKYGFAVLSVGASDAKRWKPGETDVIVRMIQQVQKKLKLNEQQIVAGGFGAGAEMALMLAFRERESVRGAFVPAGARPGGFSLKENDPASPTQVLVVGGTEIPVWGRVIASRGFPVLVAPTDSKEPLEDEESRNAISRWLKALDRI